jgi:hypothetical protein
LVFYLISMVLGGPLFVPASSFACGFSGQVKLAAPSSQIEDSDEVRETERTLKQATPN